MGTIRDLNDVVDIAKEIMKKDKNIIKVVALAIIIRSGFYYLPIINQLSSGFAMTISALASAFIGAVLFNKGEAHG